MKAPLFPFNKMIHVGVILGHLILVTTLGVSFWGFHQTVNGFESVSHSRDATKALLQLFLDLEEAEDHQRGFLLSHDPRFLTSYRLAATKVQDSLAQFQTKPESEELSTRRLQNLYPMIQKRLIVLQAILEKYTSEGPQAVQEAITKGAGINLMNDIRNFILNITQDDAITLQTLHANAHDMESLTIRTMIVGMALTLMTGLITLWKLRQDLLERQHLQRRVLEEAKLAEVSRLIGDVSHDIKNMLTPVQMGMNLLEEELNDFFRQVPTGNGNLTRQAQTLSTEVITMARRGTGRIQERVKEIAEAVKGRSSLPYFGACQLHDVIDHVYEALRLYAEEREVILQQKGLESLPVIRADQKRLFNAFYNLVNNAIPEVSAGGSITITGEVGPDDQHILVRVADTGRGMPTEVRESLFTETVLSRKPGGTGLGTKIVKDVVDSHGGTIRVDSQEGEGTTFTICLPKDGPLSIAA